MTRDLFVITESYLDYKGADATNHGVFNTLEEAKKKLRKVLIDMFDLTNRCEYGDTEIDGWIKEKIVYEEPKTILWAFDDGDSTYRFYIDKITADI